MRKSAKSVKSSGLGLRCDFAAAYKLGCQAAILKYSEFGSTNPLPESNRAETLPEIEEDAPKSTKSRKSAKSPTSLRPLEGAWLRGLRDSRG